MTLKNQESPEQSRRRFFGNSIKLMGAGAIAVTAVAQTTPKAPTDIDLLNYALTLENLEAAFYVQGLAKLTAADFAASKAVASLGGASAASVMDYLKIIRDHEVTHVNTITTVIKSLGGTPVAACTSYNFTYANADDFLKLGMALENTGVSAYDGAVALIQNPDLRTAAASIATVEARHASYLNSLNGVLPFPDPFDTPKTMAEILAIATPLLGAGCVAPVTPPPPVNTTKAVANPKNATVLSTTTLDASASAASDGKPLTYLWKTAPGGKTAAILNANTANPQVQFGEGYGYYNFMLTVTDSTGAQATDTTSILYVGH